MKAIEKLSDNGFNLRRPLLSAFVLVALTWFVLSGCGSLGAFSIGDPFYDDKKSINVGSSTRSDVNKLLGSPFWESSEQNSEIYRAQGAGLEFWLPAPYVPLPRGVVHFLLVVYDEKERVSSLKQEESIGDEVTIYSGGYGYHVSSTYLGTSVYIFPSIDDGGMADQAWGTYSEFQSYSLPTTKARMLHDLCWTAKRGQPCAFQELGNFFWSREIKHSTGNRYDQCPSLIDLLEYPYGKDDAKACFWYAMSNEQTITQECRKVLSGGDIVRVEQLLSDLEPNLCEQLISPYVDCGSAGLDLCVPPKE